MLTFLSEFLRERGVDCFAPIPLSACRIIRPYLLEHAGIGQTGTAVMIAVPYLVREALCPDRNVSLYAVSKDYHLYFRQLFDEWIPLLREKYPEYRFAGFADHSPIAETDAAVRAGLGILGDHRLLITPKYASFVFLGELITDACLCDTSYPVRECEHCGNCKRVCPSVGGAECLSALTQKKGTLTPDEEERILRSGCAWGCDRCQLSCPHAKRALAEQTAYSPLPFFRDSVISRLSVKELDAMGEEEFRSRAYSWRTRETIRRNLLLTETANTKGEEPCSD